MVYNVMLEYTNGHNEYITCNPTGTEYVLVQEVRSLPKSVIHVK